MKKYTQSPRHLKHIQRRARRSLAARLRFKGYRRQRNREEGRRPQADRQRLHQFHHQPIPYTKVTAPPVLSFVQNPEEVSSFISNLGTCFNKRTPVWVVLKNVKEITYDGITVLLSVVIRFKSNQIRFNGDLPSDTGVRQTLQESGFFDHLLNENFRDRDTYALTSKSLIHTHAMRNVDSVLGQKIIESASETVWGQRRRCPGVQRAFIELMLNTNNHASLEKEGEKHWWLSVKHIKEEGRVKFSFVDYGVGVFHSLKNKRPGSKFFDILERLQERFRYGNNADVLKLIFQGELHRTATGKPFRGKGLPGIYEALEKNKISNFVMITNNVFFNSLRKEYRILSNEFQGTFVYWELTQQNQSLPHEN